MKKLIFVLLSIVYFSAFAQNTKLSTKEFLRDFFANPVAITISDALTYSTQVSYSDANSVMGKINGYSESEFIVVNNNGTANGFIIISKKEDIAFKIESTENADVHFNKASVHSLLCTEYGNENPFPQNSETNTPTLEEITVPILQSQPGAKAVVFLDFDGHATPNGKLWNNGSGFYSTTSSFTSTQIRAIWANIAEDYAPFNINITTDSTLYTAAPGYNRMRVVFSPTTSWYSGYSGGVAYKGTFNYYIYDIPCFIFTGNLSYSSIYCAEAASHEIGHTLGLSHDGNSYTGYYSGHNGWNPIMGTAYDYSVSQFSKGEYSDANNLEDDIQIITNTLFDGMKSDDYGNTILAAQELIYTTAADVATIAAASNKGLINTAVDKDVFHFTTTGGIVNLLFKPSGEQRVNLDIQLKLFNNQGSLINTYTTDHFLIKSGVTINTTLTAGSYYIEVDGIGTGDPITGWSDYNSMGPYEISGTFPSAQSFNYDVAINSISGIPASGCGSSISPVITIQNLGMQTLNNVQVQVYLNAVLTQTFTHNTSLVNNASENITLSNIGISVFGSNIINVVLSNPNGNSDQSSNNNSLSNTFSINDGNSLTFNISTASLNSNISWNISENGSPVVSSAAVGSTINGNFTSQNFCLANNACYDFTLSNAFISDVCAPYLPWNASTVYQVGDRLVYLGNLYEVIITVWGGNPINFPQYYTNISACTAANGSDYFELIDNNTQATLATSTLTNYTSPANHSFCLGVATSTEKAKENVFYFYPNPVENQIVYFNQSIEKVNLFDVNGKLILSESNSIQMTVNTISEGIYFLQFISNGSTQTSKLIVQ